MSLFFEIRGPRKIVDFLEGGGDDEVHEVSTCRDEVNAIIDDEPR